MTSAGWDEAQRYDASSCTTCDRDREVDEVPQVGRAPESCQRRPRNDLFITQTTFTAMPVHLIDRGPECF